MSKMTARERILEVFDVTKYKEVCKELSKVIVGLEEARDLICACLLAGGHFLIDGPPGYAKTRLARAIGAVNDMNFTKVQLAGDQTSDAMKGYEMPIPTISVQQIESVKEEMVKTIIRPGPLVGAQLFLFDEVSRANEEIHNTLFSALEEGYFTIGDKTYDMDILFTVLATRNVFEVSGVRPLGFAFLDRFTLSTMLKRVSAEQEQEIAVMPRGGDFEKLLNKVWKKEEIVPLRTLMHDPVGLFDKYNPIVKYLRKLVRASDPHLDENKDFVEKMLELPSMEGRRLDIGGSQRSTQWFSQLAAVYVYCILREETILPEHIQYLAKPLLRHRLIFKDIGEGESIVKAEKYIEEIIKKTPVYGD